jgi:hypothetical protein
MLELKGEGFYGRGDQDMNGLGAVYDNAGAVGQSLVRGGWVQATLKPVDKWSVNAMAGFESDQEDSIASGAIYRNGEEAVNVMWDVSPELTMSLEFGHIHSFYVAADSGNDYNTAFGVKYKFGSRNPY